MTWGEFKRWMEDGGVKDEDEIWYMDWHRDPWDQKPEKNDEGWSVT